MTVASDRRRPLLTCLPVRPGEERAAQATLRQALQAAVTDGELALLLWSGAATQGWSDAAGVRPIHIWSVADAAADPLAAVLRAATGRCPQHDVLFLRPGAAPPRAFDARLHWAVYAQPQIGLTAPLSTDALGPLPLGEAGWDAAAIDRLVYGLGQRQSLETPLATPDCCCLRRDALDAADVAGIAAGGSSDALFAELVRRFQRRGFCIATADHVWLGRTPPQGVRAGREAGAGSVAASPRFAPLAEAVRDALAGPPTASPIPGVDDRPVQLHVIHGWGGGLGRWVEDYCRADDQRTNMVLRPIGDGRVCGQALALYRHVDDAEPLCRWTLDPPIATTAIAHLQYQQILHEIIDRFGVGGILVSSLLGQSLDALRTPLPTRIICHNYYPVCSAISGCFRGACPDCGRTRLAACLQGNPLRTISAGGDVDDWLALREGFVEAVLSRHLPLAAPSESARQTLIRLEPRLASAPFRIIPHGVDWPTVGGALPPAREKPLAVVLGRLTQEKGADLLAEALPELTALVDLALLGCGEGGERFAGRPGVTLVPHYDVHELPAILADMRPDFGLLLSIVPETFSYTLSELTLAGVPAVAANLGAFAERIEHGRTGWLFAPAAAELVAAARSLCEQRNQLDAVRKELRQRPHASRASMAAEHRAALPLSGFCEALYARGRFATAVPAAAPAPVVAGPGAPLAEAVPGLWQRIMAEETFSSLLGRVYQVARIKLDTTPRLREWQRPVGRLLLGGLWRVLKLGQQLIRRRWQAAARKKEASC